jgi:cobalt-zinc-cadmium efflux system outer membrane protein
MRSGWVCSAVFLCAPAAAAGQAAAPETAKVHVGELLREGKGLVTWLAAHQPEVQAAAARVGQANADWEQSRLFLNPELNLTLGDVPLGTTNPPGLTFNDTAIGGISLTQPLEIAKRGPRSASSQLQLQAARESALDTLADHVGTARAALARVVYLGGRQKALDQSLAAARSIEELQKTRLEHGDLSGNDYDRLAVDTLLLASDVRQNKSAYATALLDCRAALTADCDASDALPEDLDLAADVAAAATGWEDRVSARPDLRALALSEKSAGQDALLARRHSIPDPSLSIGYTRDKLTISGDQPRTLFFGVTLPLPLFDHGQKAAARSELKATELRRSREATLAQARAQTEALVERCQAYTELIAQLRSDAQPKSRRVLQSMLEAVGQGESSMTDLLLARRTDTDLALKLLDLEWSAFSARNDLRQAGGLDAELVRQVGGEPWTHP